MARRGNLDPRKAKAARRLTLGFVAAGLAFPLLWFWPLQALAKGGLERWHADLFLPLLLAGAVVSVVLSHRMGLRKLRKYDALCGYVAGLLLWVLLLAVGVGGW